MRLTLQLCEGLTWGLCKHKDCTDPAVYLIARSERDHKGRIYGQRELTLCATHTQGSDRHLATDPGLFRETPLGGCHIAGCTHTLTTDVVHGVDGRGSAKVCLEHFNPRFHVLLTISRQWGHYPTYPRCCVCRATPTTPIVTEGAPTFGATANGAIQYVCRDHLP